jgi:hypothetical protein
VGRFLAGLILKIIPSAHFKKGHYLFPKTLKSWLVVLLVLIGLGYFTHNKLVQKRLAGYGPVARQTIQESTDAQPLQRVGYVIEPVARYEIRAKVLSTERYRIGRGRALAGGFCAGLGADV